MNINLNVKSTYHQNKRYAQDPLSITVHNYRPIVFHRAIANTISSLGF